MNCKLCNNEFVANFSSSKYCSRRCYKLSKARRANAKISQSKRFDRICVECGEKFSTSYIKVKLCSKECISKFNSRTRSKFLDIPSCLADASRKLDKKLGYVRVYAPMHAEANTWGYVYEHRLVAEQMIGRALLKNEIVHHKNGKRWDNRLENLEVMNKSDHAKLHGQREQDKNI